MAYAGSVDSDNSDPNYITPKIDGTKQTDVSYRHHKYFFVKFLKLGIIYTLGYIEWDASDQYYRSINITV